MPRAADVLTIENSRSGDEMIAALATYGYSRDLGAASRSACPPQSASRSRAMATCPSLQNLVLSRRRRRKLALWRNCLTRHLDIAFLAPGPGVYDVHSPAVPPVDALRAKIKQFVDTGVLAGHPERLWINPDCGLKTRDWVEVLLFRCQTLLTSAARSRACHHPALQGSLRAAAASQAW